MMALSSVLPPPKHAAREDYTVMGAKAPASTSRQLVSSGSRAPPYGKRKGWIPRVVEDFGDGGSFPEIHVAQYPLHMGRKQGQTAKTVAVSTDAQGRIKYDAVINPGGKKQLFSRHEDMAPKLVEDDGLAKPGLEEEAATTQRTKQALDLLVNGRIAAAQPKTIPSHAETGKPQFIRYTPSQQGGAFNSGAESRIIRMTEMPSDPLEPPKFKHKKVPRGPPSPPVPVMHSPPRKVTVKDQQDWKIPPCISNWKNNKGYTIPLDKRLAADGRGLQEVVINDNFAKLSESLYLAERNAREEVANRAEVEQRLKLKEKERKEEQLRKLAQEARMERSTSQVTRNEDTSEEKERRERDQLRNQRKREIERDLRMSRNKSAASRNADRDVGEKIALGQAVGQASTETMYDQRLFNQSEGMDSGFGDEDSYNVYSKPLFHGSSATLLYKPKKNDEESYGGKEDYNKLLDTSKFKPSKGFAGTDQEEQNKQEPRSEPVEFEKEQSDPFGLDAFLSNAKKSSKSALDNIGTSGHMNVSSSNITGALEGGSKRGRIDFQESGRDEKRRR